MAGLSSMAGSASGGATATPAGAPTATATPAKNPTKTPTPTGATGKPSSLLDPRGFQAAQRDLQLAQRDFATLKARLDHPDWVLATAQSVPGVDGQLRSVQALANVGYDASSLGGQLLEAALPIVTRLHGASLGDTDLLTPDDLSRL